MADDRIQRPNVPYTTDKYDEQNEAAFRREMMTLYAEVDAALLRLGQTLSESVVDHASNHETGGSDPITALAATVLTTGVLADARVQESNVTQHQAALSITESQISDLAHKTNLGSLDSVTDASSAAGWYLRTTAAGTWAAQLGLTEADVTAHQAALSITESQISDLQAYLLNITGESIKNLSDVYSSMVPNDGDVLTYDTVNGWQSEPASGGVTDHGALTGLGDDDHTQYILADGTRAFTGAVTFDSTQDIVITPGAVPKIASTGILQLDAASGNYHYFSVNGSTVGTWGADYLTVGPSTTTDFKIHEPTAGRWTLEAQSTNALSLLAGAGLVYVDDANVLVREGADVARVKLQRANTSLASPSAVTAGNWIGDLQWYAYDDAGYDLVAYIRASASETQTATLHGTDLIFYATPDGQTTNDRFMWYDATNDHVEIDKYLLVDDAGAALEITSTADAKIILRDDGTAAWNRIDFYELTDRHGYIGFGTANNLLIVNEESAGVLKLETTGGGQIQLDDGGTNDGRVASIKAITATATAPTGDYPYGCLHLIY